MILESALYESTLVLSTRPPGGRRYPLPCLRRLWQELLAPHELSLDNLKDGDLCA
jgi:hypothetical protein